MVVGGHCGSLSDGPATAQHLAPPLPGQQIYSPHRAVGLIWPLPGRQTRCPTLAPLRPYVVPADLSGATLTGANLFGTTFTGANLRGADLSHVRGFTQTLAHGQIDERTVLPPERQRPTSP
ncbi:pentapeptide repeat-containing protein [Streptomyces sp. NPDC054855]